MATDRQTKTGNPQKADYFTDEKMISCEYQCAKAEAEDASFITARSMTFFLILKQ